MEKHYFVFLIVLWMRSFMVSSSASSTNSTDQLALLAFKTLTTNTNNVLANNWTTKTSFCNWIGVSCSPKRQRVTALKLANMNLQGTISPLIANLSFLIVLNLGNNSFHGSLPYGLGHLPRLRVIEIPNNQLEGNIPPSLFQNQKLQTISLAYNKFTGDLLRESWTLPELRILNFSGNNLKGTIHPSIGNISKLERLAMDNNSLYGNIPKEIGNLSHIIELKLVGNKLTGSIPPAIFNISSLRVIDLENNSLSGSLRIDVGNHLLKLEALYLSYNRLSGDIPSSLCQFGELRFLLLEHNNFTGPLPRNIGCLAKLERLYLTSNEVTGTIPPSLGNVSSLQAIGCVDNNIEGDIPQELGNLLHLQMLGFDYNILTGIVPESIFNITSLEYIAFVNNRLLGHIPSSTGSRLPNLKGIFLADNQFIGEIPIFISNSSKLIELELSYNFFTGLVPTNLGNLRQLEFLNLAGNQLTNEPRNLELGFFSSLVECKVLEFLIVGNNPLNGILPESVGNLSVFLQMFNIENAQIKGHIPRGIGNLSSINTLVLNGNLLKGSIPSEIGELKQLQRLYLSNNELQGSIPKELCHLIHLGELILYDNELSGLVPDCIKNLSRLQAIMLSSNNLVSTLPLSVWELRDLILLNLSHNSLLGELPSEVGNLVAIDAIDLSGNRLSGEIPSTLGGLKSLRILSLSNNSFQGPIPPSFGSLISLEFLDLSSNALLGTIPRSLQSLRYLRDINVSFNHLQGEIPSGGVFANSSAQSFMGNKELCGFPRLQVLPCATNTLHESKLKMLFLKGILPAIASMILIVALVSLWIRRRRLPKRNVSVPDESLQITTHPLVSHHELQKATENFSEANLLGVGGCGYVYKGTLSDGMVVAVKVLDLQYEGAFKSFDAECEVMRRLRHRNLVKIITTCSNQKFRAIVLQYMPNGSLEKWLHTPNCCLDLLQRINIMLDVAMAIEYLHHGYGEPVVHCDLKPSNVLLDTDMVARVSDFGITKILAENKITAQTKTLGTIGYIAPGFLMTKSTRAVAGRAVSSLIFSPYLSTIDPNGSQANGLVMGRGPSHEYGSKGMVSTSIDVYSYGIMLMEMLSKRKPTDEMFTENLCLRQWVNASYPTAVMGIIDAKLFHGEGEVTGGQGVCISSIMELALDCSMEAPEERINMKDVVARLNKIRQALAN